jgi:DNA-binding beta-propeller fold protein YncE
MIALMRIFLPILSANHIPFQGNLPHEQEATGRWIAAGVVVVISGYFIWKLALQVGWIQTRRLAVLSLTLILTVITIRSAWLFSYVNYDYATEFGVYAHSGPAVKRVMEVVDEFAARSPEGKNILIVYDSDSSWPLVWYLRDYPNKRFIVSESPDPVDPGVLSGADIVIMGFSKNNEVAQILGDDYYRFDYIRLWWPMQEYFNLNYDRVNNVFQEGGGFSRDEAYREEVFSDWVAQEYNRDWIQDLFIGAVPTASLYREAMFDIWWGRDYDRYGQAECVESRYNQCVRDSVTNSSYLITLETCIASPNLQVCQDSTELSEITKQKLIQWQACAINPTTEGCDSINFVDEYRVAYNNLLTCVDTVTSERAGMNSMEAQCEAQNTTQYRRKYAVENWPVSSALYLYVRKDFAAQIWDVGLDGRSVAERLVPDPENVEGVVQTINGLTSVGGDILVEPRGVASDSQGNIYVVDASSQINRIYVFNPQGNLIRTIGNEGITDPRQREITQPWGVEVSPLNGNIYVTDFWGGHRVVVYSPDGQLIETYGRFGDLTAGADPTDPEILYGPRDIAIDNQGNIYVADTGNHRIRVYTPDWTHLRDIGSEGTSDGQLLEPVGIAIHPMTGDLYIAETWNQRISVFRRDGIFLRSWKVNMWRQSQQIVGRPYLTISPDGTLILVSDMNSEFENNGPRVVGYDLNGLAVISFNGLVPDPDTGQNLQVGEVSGLAFAPNGNFYVVDTLNKRVAIFPPLQVSGNVQPGVDPNYYQPEGTETTPVPTEPETTVIETRSVEEVALLYLAALSTGDYELYKSLYCPAVLGTLPDTSLETFNANTARPFLGAYTDEVQIIVEDGEAQSSEVVGCVDAFCLPVPLTDAATTIRWSGFIVFNRGSVNEQRIPAETLLQPIELQGTNNVWAICPNLPTSPAIFGGGG